MHYFTNNILDILIEHDSITVLQIQHVFKKKINRHISIEQIQQILIKELIPLIERTKTFPTKWSLKKDEKTLKKISIIINRRTWSIESNIMQENAIKIDYTNRILFFKKDIKKEPILILKNFLTNLNKERQKIRNISIDLFFEKFELINNQLKFKEWEIITKNEIKNKVYIHFADKIIYTKQHQNPIKLFTQIIELIFKTKEKYKNNEVDLVFENLEHFYLT